ncbi:MAG: DUF3631 domain-containing protein, partial [Archaeoglobaceae archaeon]
MTLNEFVQILKERGCKPKQLQNGQWLALCPAHDDHEPSLSITEGEKGILLNCFAGCSTRDICSALQISERDLFTDSGQLSTPRGCTFNDLAEGCQPLRDALVVLGCREMRYGDLPAVAFPFKTVKGETFYHYRIAPEGSDKWRLQVGAPAKQLVFGLEQALQRVQQTNALIITESPLDSSVLFACGFASASVIGKANAYALAEFRNRIPVDCQIFAWVEPQADDFAQGVADALQRPVFAFHSPNPQAKDAYRLLKANGWDIMKTRDQVVCAMQATVEVLPTPRTLAEILDRIVSFIRKYVVLTPEQANTIALWVAHTYAIDATDTTPYLRINSATKRCGKTRLAEVISCLAYEPRLTTCLSVASLFRLIHAYNGRLTLIVDEVAGTFAGKEKSAELSALLNAGWRRGLTVPRVEKTKSNNFVVREYQTFAPKVLVGIGQLHDTVEDRSIRILLQRKRPDEEISDFFLSDAFREAEPIRRALEQWASQPEVIETLKRARPQMPRSVSDRAREGWRLLVAIADLAGQEWGARARKAMQALECTREDNSFGILLLKALKDIFTEQQKERLTAKDIAEALQEMNEPPVPENFWRWIAVGDFRRIGIWLAQTLKPFGITPIKWREGNEIKRGYARESFADVWARYLNDASSDELNTTVASVAFSETNATQNATQKSQENKGVSANCGVCGICGVEDIYAENSIKLTQGHEDNQNCVASTIIQDATDATNATSQQKANKNMQFSRGDLVASLNSVATLSEIGEQSIEPQKATGNSTNLPKTDKVDTVRWLCVQCWLEVQRPMDADLFGTPRCPNCGQPMRELPPDKPPSGAAPQPSAADANEQTNGGEKFVDTFEFLEQNFGPLQEVHSDPFAEKEVPQEVIDQWLADSSDLTLDQWLQRKCRLTANLLL